jgi:excisionase family DNA binding protein
MLTVREAARRVRRSPATIRRWIRSERLRAVKIGARYMIHEAHLESAATRDEQLPLPKGWQHLRDGRPMPNIVRLIRLSRQGH